jgi:hypothetical protein
MGASMPREQNPNWKGGKYISSHGYIKILVGTDHHLADGSGYAYEHLLVAEEKLGRLLKRGEIVHHKNTDRQDNSPENLEVVGSIGEHCLRHRKITGKRLRNPGEDNPDIFCACGCGQVFPRFDAAGRERKYIPGHNIQSKPRPFCACGCGERVKTSRSKYLPNHWSRAHETRINNKEIVCACGCGTVFMEYDQHGRRRSFISGHNNKGGNQ